MSKVEEISMRVGAVVKRRRQELGMSQEALASKCKLHRTYLSDVERGGRNISLHTLVRLAEALDCTTAELIADAEAAVRHNAASSSPMYAESGSRTA